MRYQKTNPRRAVILMVVLSLLALFALVGVTFVLYADAEAAAARVAREAQTQQFADVDPKEALSFFLGQLIYDVPDTATGAASGLRGHSLARTMYGLNYTVPAPLPGLNTVPFNGIGRMHYGCPSMVYPPTGLNNVPANWGTQLDDYAMVNYTWFKNDGFLRDPERFGIRNEAQLTGFVQPNPYVGGNAPYTYPDLNSFFLAAVRADGTVLTPSYHRPWLFQMAGGKFYPFNDMLNPNWTNPQGKYLTLRPRPAEHPTFPLPGDATGDVKNLTWAPGGNDSIWIDLGAPVMTAPDGTLYKMMFAPLIMDLDGRVNLNTAGNILGSINALTASSGLASAAAWQAASGAHVSNQGWGSWEVNLSKVLYGDQILYPTTVPPTPPEWMRLFTGMSYATTNMPPNTQPFITVAGAIPIPSLLPPTPGAPLSAWLLPGIPGRYLESVPGAWTPNAPIASVAPWYPSALGLNTTYQHPYSMSDINGLNELATAPLYATSTAASNRPLVPGSLTNPAINPFAMFLQGYGNGNAVEATNHPLLYNVFQNPLNNTYLTRAFTARDMSALLRPNASVSGPVDAGASAATSDLQRLCPLNFPSDATLATIPTGSAGPPPTPNWRQLAMRYRNLVTTQSWDIGSPGVMPYWWNGMTTGYLASNPGNYLLAPFAAQPSQGAAIGFPALPPGTVGNIPGTNPSLSEFGPDGRAVSANTLQYFPTTNPAGYVTPGARIRLNRPLPPYPHMGALLMPPYNPAQMPPNATPSPYGVAYNVTNAGINNQYLAAQNARQALANDIYRRLLAITGLPKVANTATPLPPELAPRRWLAQLAVNIVDYIDEDDIMTPFNFYVPQDNPNAAGVPQPLVPPAPVAGNPVATQGPDDPGTPTPTTSNYLGTNTTGANPDYWVFGTEMPKVVLNEVLAQAQNPDPTKGYGAGSDSVRVWVELFNTMPNPALVNPTTLHTQPQDAYRVPLYMTNPAGSSYSPYRVSIAQYTMEKANSPTTLTNPPFAPALPDNSANVLGKAYVTTPPAPATSLPQSTTDVDFSGVIPLSQSLTNPPPAMKPTQVPFTVPGSGNIINAGVDAGNFFLIGPTSDTTNYPNDPFVSPGLPNNIPVLQTTNVTYTPNWTNPSPAAPNGDERSYGLTVMLRRLANPYLPPQLNPTSANYNPYVTIDYIRTVPIQGSKSPAVESFGKRQPFAGLNLFGNLFPPNPVVVQPPFTGSFVPASYSPVTPQSMTSTPTPPAGSIITTNKVSNTFGLTNYPLPQSGHYDWLVHLDRPPISPMELLHVSAWPPYKLTQHFMRGDDTKPVVTIPATGPTPALTYINTFGHYAPWLDAPPAGITAANLSTLSCPWWYDLSVQAGPSSHRLYRLFEFLESGDRAFGVNGLGRIPGKININTIWDAEILQSLIDANPSMGINVNPSNTPLTVGTDPVSQVFSNMMASRSVSYYNNGAYANLPPAGIPIGPVNMGTGLDDRPFMPLSTGLYLPVPSPTPSQYPNGFSVVTDTLLRTNNPFAKTPTTYPTTGPANNLYLLFQNYNDGAATVPPVPGGLTTSQVHPYMQTQMLTKLYNNVTTRSNVFAVFLTVGFFQVTDATTTPPTLGPEMGRSEGKQIRHRMFAVVDRSNLATCVTTSTTPVTGVTPTAINPALNMTGNATVVLPVLPLPFTITGAGTQLYVPNLTTGMPGLIQPGTQLVIDAGTPLEETVTVISVTPPVGAAPASINANFTLPHGVGFSITQRGNPGPWMLIPYDPRLDPSVVPYFSIID